MSEGPLDKVYAELKQARDEIRLKIHLGGMELRDEWNELDGEWESWVHEVGETLKSKGEDLGEKIREAGGEDLRKIEIKSELAIKKFKKSFNDMKEKLADKE